MRINELFEALDSNVKGEIVRATNDLYTTKATIGDRVIVFNAASYTNTDDTRTIWEIEFIEKNKMGTSYGKTGSGKELQVFSFVLESMRDLVSKYSPDEIVFGSHKADVNRTSLYVKLMKRLNLSNYTSLPHEPGTYTDTFRIVRDDLLKGN